LFLEGLLMLLSCGNCPLGPLLRRLGDDRPLFELLLASHAAKLAVPMLAAATTIGMILLGTFLRSLEIDPLHRGPAICR
jgi:hypothetical protein